MTLTSIDDLVRAESGLNRAFVGDVAAVVGTWAWALYLGGQPSQSLDLALVSLTILVAAFALLLWYASAAGTAAKALGARAWRYVVWVIAAPLIALVPIPLVSTLVALSPLSIRFLLGGQLQAAIREQGPVHVA